MCERYLNKKDDFCMKFKICLCILAIVEDNNSIKKFDEL